MYKIPTISSPLQQLFYLRDYWNDNGWKLHSHSLPSSSNLSANSAFTLQTPIPTPTTMTSKLMNFSIHVPLTLYQPISLSFPTSTSICQFSPMKTLDLYTSTSSSSLSSSSTSICTSTSSANHDSVQPRMNQSSCEIQATSTSSPSLTTLSFSEIYHKLSNRFLGIGSFGNVQCYENKNTKNIVAVKTIPNIDENLIEIQREILVLQALQNAGEHRNIMKFYNVYLQYNFYYLVIEYIKGFTLYDYLHLHSSRRSNLRNNQVVKQQSNQSKDKLAGTKNLSLKEQNYIMKELMNGLAFLHSNHILHRDLKPDNIMISIDSETQQLHVKLIDFGSACLLKNSATLADSATDTTTATEEENENLCNMMNNFSQPRRRVLLNSPSESESPVNELHEEKIFSTMLSGTKCFWPPEMLAENEKENMMMGSKASDVWALGCIFYIICTGRHPFDLYGNSNYETILQNIQNNEVNINYISHLPSALQSLILRALEKNPTQRITIYAMLEEYQQYENEAGNVTEI